MYAGPASGITPTFDPSPPLGHETGPITGPPVMPSPTTGSRSRWICPTFFGHPAAYGGGGGAGGPGSPVAGSTYTRLLAKLSGLPGTLLSAATEAAVSPAFNPPSWSSGYSSLVPTTISGLPSPSMSATAGGSMIA